MLKCFTSSTDSQMVPIKPLLKIHLEPWLQAQNEQIKRWVQATRFVADPGTACLVPNEAGGLALVLVALTTADDFWALGDLAMRVPEGKYFLDADVNMWPQQEQWHRAIIAWGSGCYNFNRYKRAQKTVLPKPQLFIPANADANLCEQWVASLYWVRDLINTPTEDMSPEVLANAALEFAKTYNCQANVIVGEDLLKANYPTVYAVGRASSRKPRLIDLHWGDQKAPKLTLVGKGICFDSGGLNLKSSDGMLTMKKDMAGAAHVLGLARMIITQKLPVNLRVLIPAAENMLSGNSYRPGDVIITRAGITVEVTNTDAEGRLVLCDALSAAVDESLDLLLDFSTLTGAARVALGPEIPAFFSNNSHLTQGLLQAADQSFDPLWSLPLYQPYERYLKSEVADFANAALVSQAGAITAALYLKQFVPKTVPWAHFDMSAWNFEKLPGRWIGAEMHALRAVFNYLRTRYQSSES